MTLMLAIVADDLTGALDTSAPFVMAGLKVAVAMTADKTEEALAAEPDVFAVSTASRALPAEVAAARVEDAARQVMSHSPRIVMKKIDSRLKGNVAVEAAALAKASGRATLIVAPAVPDQGRTTLNGAVVGRGVDVPMPITSALSRSDMAVTVQDAASDADLDRIVVESDWDNAVAVGARGLGLALARHLGGSARGKDHSFPADDGVLYAFGSRDPITDGQVARLRHDHRGIGMFDAPAGRFELPANARLPLMVRCTGDQVEDPGRVAADFAAGVGAAVECLRPSTLVIGGGDTALAILGALGAGVLFPQGEVAPGLPWFTIAMRHGGRMRCVVKSGGFGTVAVLSDLLRPRTGEQAELT